jgi:hypothetical protein
MNHDNSSDTVPGCFSFLRKCAKKSSASSTPAAAACSAHVQAPAPPGQQNEKQINYTYASCCSFGQEHSPDKLWRFDDNEDAVPPSYVAHGDADVYRPEVLKTIEGAIDDANEDLRALSLDIHSHPEIMFQEKCVLPASHMRRRH